MEKKPIISVCIPSVFATVNQLAKPGYKRKAMKDNSEGNVQPQESSKPRTNNDHCNNYEQRRAGNRGTGYNRPRQGQRRGYNYRGQEQIDENYDEVENGMLNKYLRFFNCLLVLSLIYLRKIQFVTVSHFH